MDSWKGYYSVLAPNLIDDASLPYYACGQTAFTVDEYAGCLKQKGP